MSRLLVTGMSGTGKSTVLAELARRGRQVVDTDDPGWAEDVPLPGGPGVERLWREDRISGLLARPGSGLVVSGCVANQGRFYDRFDAVVLLSLPVDLLVQRLATRDTNRFGRQPGELARILEDLDTVEPLLRASATVEIVTTRPVAEVADAIEALTPGSGRAR